VVAVEVVIEDVAKLRGAPFSLEDGKKLLRLVNERVGRLCLESFAAWMPPS